MTTDPILEKLDDLLKRCTTNLYAAQLWRPQFAALLAEVAIEYAGVALVGYDLEREDIRKRFGVAPPSE